MVSLSTLQPRRFYCMLFSGVSIVMILALLFLPRNYAYGLTLIVLLCLPLAGYLLDTSFNRLITHFHEAEARIQGSFQKFEARERQYQYTVEELQKELTKLQQLNVNLQEASTLEQILYHITQATHYILDFDRTQIFLYHKDTHTLQWHQVDDRGQISTPLTIPLNDEGGVLAKAFREQQTYHIHDFESAPQEYFPVAYYYTIFPPQTTSVVILPLMVNEQGVGVLTIDNLSEREPITEQQVELLKLFAYQASLAIATIKMQTELSALNSELQHSYKALLERKDFYSMIAQDLSSSMTEMSFSIAEVTRSAHILTEQSENLSGRGSELLKHLTKIDDIIASINNVTRQTKLLAFNATVEAIRVGEAGRGFAVVAEEVRKLAQRSADDSTTIKATLTAMQSSIKAIAEVADATHNIAVLQQQGTEQMNIVTKDVMKRAEDLVESLQD